MVITLPELGKSGWKAVFGCGVLVVSREMDLARHVVQPFLECEDYLCLQNLEPSSAYWWRSLIATLDGKPLSSSQTLRSEGPLDLHPFLLRLMKICRHHRTYQFLPIASTSMEMSQIGIFFSSPSFRKSLLNPPSGS